MFTQELLEKIKSATNLKNLAEEYGAKLSKASSELWQGRCPHPDHRDSTPSFRIWHNKNGSWSWCCMGCHCGQKDLKNKLYGTDCFAFLQWITDYEGSSHKLTFSESVKILAQKAGIILEEEKYSDELHQNYIQAMAYHNSIPKKVLSYLKNRGLDNDDIIKWKIGFTCLPEFCTKGKNVARVVFPLIAPYNKILGFSARKLTEENIYVPKYINSPNSDWFQKKRYFYGSHLLDDSVENAIITEGVFDVILAHKYGLKNVLAPLGTSFTEEHAQWIKSKNKIPIFCMDGDSAGRKSTQKAIEKMSALGIYSKVLLLPEGKDLADIANDYKNELPNYFSKNQIFYWQYILKDTTTEFENKLQEIKMKMLPAIKKALRGVNTEEELFMISNYLKERLNIHVNLRELRYKSNL